MENFPGSKEELAEKVSRIFSRAIAINQQLPISKETAPFTASATDLKLETGKLYLIKARPLASDDSILEMEQISIQRGRNNQIFWGKEYGQENKMDNAIRSAIRRHSSDEEEEPDAADFEQRLLAEMDGSILEEVEEEMTLEEKEQALRDLENLLF
ncbi:MAG: hypothetical protein R3B52_02805 [Candidatus Paceibacterota bacterium]